MTKPQEPVHIVPVGDIKPHAETGTACWCNPTTRRYEGGGIMVIHNTLDGRDLIERHGLN